MLRNTVGGQASESRHITGQAADVQFPDVALKQMRYAAMVREKGGVGYYPTSATPFVHVDTDRVRAWPRLPRFELALLFPNGRTSTSRPRAVRSRPRTCVRRSPGTRMSPCRSPPSTTCARGPPANHPGRQRWRPATHHGLAEGSAAARTTRSS